MTSTYDSTTIFPSQKDGLHAPSVLDSTAKLLEPLRENQLGYPSPVASFARLHSSLEGSSSQLPIFPIVSSASLQMLSLVLEASRLTPLGAYHLHLSPLHPSLQFLLQFCAN